jgi:acyl-CoA thioester hydrolase
MTDHDPAHFDASAARLTYRGAVYPWQCDHMGHLNVMWYVGKFDEANWQLLSAIGLTPRRLREQRRGMAAVEQQISYRRELLAGDLVTVRSRVLELRDKAIRIGHEMVDDGSGEVAASAQVTAVHLDLATRRACAFAPDVRASADALEGARRD